MDKVLVDTNILIDYSKGNEGCLKDLLARQKEGKLILLVNPVIIAEFFTDDSLSVKSYFGKALNFINMFSVLGLSKESGVLAGELMRKRLVSHLGDALIAASCLLGNAKLVTRNVKHFKKVKGLRFYED